MSIGRYRKKPVEIEAMQFDGTKESANQILAWLGSNGAAAKRAHSTKPDLGLTISTLEGNMTANPGDFIIRGVQGEFYPCKPDIFAATYDEVPVGNPEVAEVTVASSNAAIRVTATDVERGDSQTIEIEDTYVLVTAGRCELTSTTAHANGTHLLTVKNAAGGTKRVVQ